jgi:ABC transport system ATP-binding/permease protein
MPSPLLHLRGIRHGFGGTPLLTGAELAVSPGDRLCLVGRNGSGKSTLLRIAADLIEPEAGEIFRQPGAVISYLPQAPDLSAYLRLGDYIDDGLDDEGKRRAHAACQALAISGDEATANVSGGEARRAALAKVLATDADVLLLDEPTNHLDLPAIEWLEAELAGNRAGLVLISHDRRFLKALSRATLWVDRGSVRRLERGFEHFEDWRDQVLADEEVQQQKLARKIVEEEHWLRYGVTARRKRNVRRLGLLSELRAELRDHRGPQGAARATAGPTADTGKIMIEAKGLEKSYGSQAIVRGLSLRFARGDRLGIVGPNGAGKTTLINLLTGLLAPDAGTVRVADTVVMASLDQKREQVVPDRSLKDEMTDGAGDFVTVGGEKRHVMGYLKEFLFTPEQARTPVKALSGGERGRLMLARALARTSNLLVLDEPTNDLDLETLDVLQELVADYKGGVIVVSHDRDFLDRTVTSILMAEGQGRWTEYAGGYDDMVSQRGHGVSARRPKTEAPARGSQKARTVEEAAAAPSPTKLSGRERQRLEALPGLIAAMERDMAKLEALIADPDLFARDRARFDKAGATLAALRSAKDEAEEEWLALEMKREG